MIDNIALTLFHLGLMVLVLRLLRWPDPDADQPLRRKPRGLASAGGTAPAGPDTRVR